MSFDRLEAYCLSLVPELSKEELQVLPAYFEYRKIPRKAYIVDIGEVCRTIVFVIQGGIRHFHIKEGEERTCDISLEDTFVTAFESFTTATPSTVALQALEDTTVLLISKKNLEALYTECRSYETIGRLIAEQVALRTTAIAMSLASEKPEVRYQNLIQSQPELLQRVPQKYIANFLGISPESLSRIRKRIVSK